MACPPTLQPLAAQMSSFPRFSVDFHAIAYSSATYLYQCIFIQAEREIKQPPAPAQQGNQVPGRAGRELGRAGAAQRIRGQVDSSALGIPSSRLS